MAEEIFVRLLSELKPKEVLGAVQQQILAQNVATGVAALELATRMLMGIGKDDIVAVLPGLFPILETAFQSKAPEIRKAVVICFVELRAIIDTQINQYLGRLTKAQQKLIAVYYARRVAT
jgi:hypothetical protein